MSPLMFEKLRSGAPRCGAAVSSIGAEGEHTRSYRKGGYGTSTHFRNKPWAHAHGGYMIMDYGSPRIIDKDPAWVSPRRIQGGISTPRNITLDLHPDGSYRMNSRTRQFMKNRGLKTMSPIALAQMLMQLGMEYYVDHANPELWMTGPNGSWYLPSAWYASPGVGSCDPGYQQSGELRGFQNGCNWCRTPGHEAETGFPPVFTSASLWATFWRYNVTSTTHIRWLRIGRFRRNVASASTDPVRRYSPSGSTGLAYQTDPKPVPPWLRRLLERNHPHNNASGYVAPGGAGGGGGPVRGLPPALPPHVRVPPGRNVRERKPLLKKWFFRIAQLALASTEFQDFVNAVAKAWNWKPSDGGKIPFIYRKWLTATPDEMAAALEAITANFLEDKVIGNMLSNDPAFDDWLRSHGIQPGVWYMNLN